MQVRLPPNIAPIVISGSTDVAIFWAPGKLVELTLFIPKFKRFGLQPSK